jgi:hypothetical protein
MKKHNTIVLDAKTILLGCLWAHLTVKIASLRKSNSQQLTKFKNSTFDL